MNLFPDIGFFSPRYCRGWFSESDEKAYTANKSEHKICNDFNEVKWMSIENGIKYLAASHVHNYIDGQAPECLQVFERVNESHHYNTRHSVNALILPKVGSYGIKSFHYIGANIWNSLADEIQTTFSKSLFNVRCKKHFMSVLYGSLRRNSPILVRTFVLYYMILLLFQS